MPLARTCERCGTPFSVYPYQVRRGEGRFCRRECFGNGLHQSVAERFASKVDKNGPIPAHVPALGPCWVWAGSRGTGGYGTLHIAGTKRLARAHRVSWELHKGPIPAGLVVMHRCDNPACVNPGHLAVGTRSENMRDMAAKGRQWQQAHPERRRRGSQSNMAVTTEDTVRIIRRLGAYGVPVKALSAAFGLSASGIQGILKGTSWGHVVDDPEAPVLSAFIRRRLVERFGGEGHGSGR